MAFQQPTEQRTDPMAATDTQQTTGPPTPQPNPHLAALEARTGSLNSTLATLLTERATLVAQTKLASGLSMPSTWSEDEKTKAALESAHGIVKEHIRLLHRYNEIKDIGQGLLGLVADTRGVRVREVMEDLGMGDKD